MEARLYKEAEYLYKKFPSLRPIEGNLRHWRGKITLKNKEEITLIITIPDDFPKNNPTFKTEENFGHQFIKNKRITIPLLINWNEKLRIYQIINSILVNFNKKFPKLKKDKKSIKENTVKEKEVKLISVKNLSFFDTELEKTALTELLETLKSFKKLKKIDQKSFKILFSRYLNEIKNIKEIEKLIM